MTPDGKKRQVGLEHAVRNWPTPTAADADRASATYPRGAENPTLLGASRNWATPTAMDSAGSGGKLGSGNLTLVDQAVRARTWTGYPTPTANDAKQSGCPAELRRRSPQLAVIAMQCSLDLGLPAATTVRDGGHFSPSNLVLSPVFDEMLMGWPRGWTACDASEMVLYPWLQHWRSVLSRLV